VSSSAAWTVIVPVKDTRRGKSRLRLPPANRQSIVLAMALDTLLAAAEVAPVLAVVETESDAAELGRIAGVHCHLTKVVGLNESIDDALASFGGASAAIAVMPADLPGLVSADLGAALRAAHGLRAGVVADHDGTGTTLLTAAEPGLLRPHFGPDSFRQHLAAGALAIDVPPASSLRMDVDVPVDLLGPLGPRSRHALTRAGLRPVPAAC
jgi:2-phospho-L-lactate guanylyltransferase